MIRIISLAACATAFSLGVPHAFAQSGSVEKAVGGYGFDEAAAEAPDTKDFHSGDGKLTFAIVTHTAGNGFFDPVYVGAKVAGNLIGADILLLGSESQEALAEAWGARLVVLADAGHLIAWEQPEALGAGLTAFAVAVTRGE